MKTHKYQKEVDRLFKSESMIDMLRHAAEGCCSEAGELMGTIKAHAVYGKDLDDVNVLEECGDLLFFVTAMLNLVGYSMDFAMATNISKLNKRYPDGFKETDAIARMDKHEHHP